MLALIDYLRQALLIFLSVTAVLVGAVVLILIVQRGVRGLLWRHRMRLETRYRPLVRMLFEGSTAGPNQQALAATAARHRRLIARLLVEPLRVVSGEPVDRAREAARGLGVTALLNRDLSDRRWWRRAEAALVLGLMRETTSYDALMDLLDNSHEEVRAAAVEALGRLGDVRAVPALLDGLSAESRHQRARIVDAVTMMGRAGTPHLLAHAQATPAHLPLLAGLLASVAGPAALPYLLERTSDEAAEIRAGAMDALGTIGIDDRSYYYALRSLCDADSAVRAMGARALGRSGREDATPYLT